MFQNNCLLSLIIFVEVNKDTKKKMFVGGVIKEKLIE